ncbi:hypothetical protein [Gymnodinialimonas sp.]
MEHQTPTPDLGTVLLSFYECLTDPAQLDALMEMLTSWLDDDDGALVSPKLDYHADQAWRLLGELSEPDAPTAVPGDALETSHFEDAQAVVAAVQGQIRPEDLVRLQGWLATDTDAETGALLLRLFEKNATELVILSRDATTGAFQTKRTGENFQAVISKFVADSFELSHAEFLLLQELLLGGTLREISDRLGKSWETTRSQVKTLTNKLGVSSQADILRMANQAATLMPARPSGAAPAARATLHKLERPDGRTLVYEIDGPPSDKTLVFLHGMTQGRHWPENGRKQARARGWRVIRISRAGRGGSSLNPKEGEPLLEDHIADVMAIMNHEAIETFSVFSAADGFALGYSIALRYPERVQMIIGLEIVPPIVSRKVINGFGSKMKTFGLACLYAPKTVKYMFGLAFHQLERMEDRTAGIHPLLGVELRKVEDADGLRADELNFQDIAAHRAEGIWRDASYSCVDWAFIPPDSNIRPKAVLIHSGNSMTKSPGYLDEFAHQIGAPIHRIDSYFPYLSTSLPLALDVLEPL